MQAFKCSTDVSSPQSTLPQDTPPAPQTQPTTKTSHGTSSSDWVSRTAALTACIPQRPVSNPDPANNASGLPTSLFSSHSASQSGTNQQGTAASPHNAKVACPPEGGALMGSSAMADSHCGVVVALALCGEYVCSAGGDAMIKVWKADSLEFVRYSTGTVSDTTNLHCVALHVEAAPPEHSVYYNTFLQNSRQQCLHCIPPCVKSASIHIGSHRCRLKCKHDCQAEH